MLKSLLLAPGFFLTGLLGNKKKVYRSVRRKPADSSVLIISLVFWAGLIVGGYALVQTFQGPVEIAKTAAIVEETPTSENATSSTGEGTATSLSGTLNPPAGTGENTATLAGAATTAPAGTGEQAGAAVASPEVWLVVLHTIPKSARDEAERRQAGYRAKGLMVEIFDTDAYPRLRDGSWIIAQGPFEDRASALKAADTAKTYNSGLMILRGL